MRLSEGLGMPSPDNRGTYAHPYHLDDNPVDLENVTRFDRSLYEEYDARNEVLNHMLHCEPDRHREKCAGREKCAHVDANGLQRNAQADEQNDVVDEA
jgi:hypothetical protein